MNNKIKIIDLLNKIANGEMEEAVFYVNGDFFYDLIVINENLHVINTKTKQLELLETKYISRFIRDNVELIRLDKEVEILEEEKKIPEKLEEFDIQGLEVSGYSMTQAEYLLEDGIKENREMLNWILDYLKSKGE